VKFAIPKLKTLSAKIGFIETPFQTSGDAWTHYERKPKPSPVPEAGTYGLALVALCLVVLGLKRWTAARL
jgi:hypothetical protein